MKREEFCEILSDINEKFVADARKKRNRTVWMKWAAAACLCLGLTFVAMLFPKDTTQESTTPEGVLPPNLTVEGRCYIQSSYVAISETLPEGFVYGGMADIGGFENCAYYINENIPEWVYVCHEVRTTGEVDASNTLIPAEPHDAYVRYVDKRLRGKDLISYEGQLYISMWSVDCWNDEPDVSKEFHNEIRTQYGNRLEDGEVPEGFVSIGVTEFSGLDTIPQGELVSNQDELEVLANPQDERVLLVETQWYTAVYENGMLPLHGYDVYIRYAGPLQ